MSERSNNASIRRNKNRKDKEREKRERDAKRRLEAPENRGPGEKISAAEKKKRAEMTPDQRRKYLERLATQRTNENKRNAAEQRSGTGGGEEVGAGDNPVVGQQPGSGSGTNPPGTKGPGGTSDGKRGDMYKVIRKKMGEDGVKRDQKGAKKPRRSQEGIPGAGAGMPSQGSIRDMVYGMPAVQQAMAMRGGRGGGGDSGFPSIVGAMFGGGAPAPNIPSQAGPGYANSSGGRQVRSSGGGRSSGSLAEDFASGRISREEFEAAMGTGGMPVARGGGGSRGSFPDPLSTPGHQQTGRARQPSPGGNYPPQGQTGRAAPPQGGGYNPYPLQGQTGRARPPQGGGSNYPIGAYPRQGQTGRAMPPPSDFTPNQPRPGSWPGRNGGSPLPQAGNSGWNPNLRSPSGPFEAHGANNSQRGSTNYTLTSRNIPSRDYIYGNRYDGGWGSGSDSRSSLPVRGSSGGWGSNSRTVFPSRGSNSSTYGDDDYRPSSRVSTGGTGRNY